MLEVIELTVSHLTIDVVHYGSPLSAFSPKAYKGPTSPIYTAAYCSIQDKQDSADLFYNTR